MKRKAKAATEIDQTKNKRKVVEVQGKRGWDKIRLLGGLLGFVSLAKIKGGSYQYGHWGV